MECHYYFVNKKAWLNTALTSDPNPLTSLRWLYFQAASATYRGLYCFR